MSDEHENGALIRHRIAELEKRVSSLETTLGGKIDSLTVRVTEALAKPHCPKPGMCLDLDAVQRRHAEELARINQTLSYFRGAVWSAGAIGGAIGAVAAVAVNFIL